MEKTYSYWDRAQLCNSTTSTQRKIKFCSSQLAESDMLPLFWPIVYTVDMVCEFFKNYQYRIHIIKKRRVSDRLMGILLSIDMAFL